MDNNEALKKLVAQGLAALKAGGKIGSQAAADIGSDARDPELKAALQEGSQTAQQWATRIDRALQEAGGQGEEDNPIVKALYEVGDKIRKTAPDDYSRDLGIIASGQLALHYWIAAFGTLQTYAAQLGLSQTEQDLQKSLDEAKAADKKHTEIAARILQG